MACGKLHAEDCSITDRLCVFAPFIFLFPPRLESQGCVTNVRFLIFFFQNLSALIQKVDKKLQRDCILFSVCLPLPVFGFYRISWLHGPSVAPTFYLFQVVLHFHMPTNCSIICLSESWMYLFDIPQLLNFGVSDLIYDLAGAAGIERVGTILISQLGRLPPDFFGPYVLFITFLRTMFCLNALRGWVHRRSQLLIYLLYIQGKRIVKRLIHGSDMEDVEMSRYGLISTSCYH